MNRICLLALLGAMSAPVVAVADAPGQGLTSRFEIEFMESTIDHHFAALRMTELAAGTDVRRTADNTPSEGTSPTPGFQAVDPKSRHDDIKSLARRNNRMQREEILTLQTWLRDWYGIQYEPKVASRTRQTIEILEKAQPGAEFDHAFLETFSRHHYTLMAPVNACLAGTDLTHWQLRAECRGMWQSQTSDIDSMRHDLQRFFGVSDYQPFKGIEPLRMDDGLPRGRHSGND